MVRLEEDTTEFGIKFEGGRKDAQKAGRWFQRVEEVAEAFMREWQDVENCRAAERHAEVAAAPPTVGISTQRVGGGGGRLRRGEGGRGEGGRGGKGRGGEGREGEGRGGKGRGGVLAKKLKSGCGHHRPDVCMPSHGRK